MLKFTKMHGLGNDFIVIDAVREKMQLTPRQIASLSPRETGIGFDQCLVVEASNRKDIDFFYRIFNANGQEVGQCGNGARCLARFLSYYKLTDKTHITVATKTTTMQLMLNLDDSVSVNMGKPIFTPLEVPFLTHKPHPPYTLDLGDNTHLFHVVNVGNPHAVLKVPNLEAFDVERVGRSFNEQPVFPEQVNVGFMQIKHEDEIDLRVYERGCGETKACGSGAVAAAVIGCVYHGLTRDVMVNLPGGRLRVHWHDDDVLLTGPASFVYEGQLIPTHNV